MCCEGQPIPQGQAVCYANICPVSDRNRKRDFAAIDGDALLDRLAAVPITTWSYRAEAGEVRHIGPMAQDFQQAFGVGATDELIFQIDADGVALAGVQTLHRHLGALQRENEALRDELSALTRRLDALERGR